MSVKQLESAVIALPPDERQEFIHWLDAHRHELVNEADDFVLTAEHKAELLRRKELFLADPDTAEPWAGTPEKIHQHLHARRTQKTIVSRH